MNFLPKRLFLLLVFATVFFANNCLAQFPGMNRVYSNMAMQNQQMMHNMMINNMTLLNNSEYNPEYKFAVVMKDSSKLEVQSKLYIDTALHQNYLVVLNKNFPKKDPRREHKIYPAQTAEISRNSFARYTLTPTQIVGVPNDTCWLFKSINGKISAYSNLPVLDFGNNMISMMLCAIQLDNGPVLKLTSADLTNMVGKNSNALKAIKKKDYYQAIKKFNKDFEKADKKE
jgi:hypothetical protein